MNSIYESCNYGKSLKRRIGVLRKTMQHVNNGTKDSFQFYPAIHAHFSL